MAATIDSQTVLPSTFIYKAHLKNGDFEGASRWVKRLSRDRSRWIFGICEAAHWVAVEINWEHASIRYYDPKDQKASTLRSEYLAQRVEAWANHLCRATDDHTRVWEIKQLQGPRQKATDDKNCGVYVSWVLYALAQGICVDEERALDPLTFRREILHFLGRAPRRPTQTKADDTEYDLDGSMLGMVATSVRDCGGGSSLIGETTCRKTETAPTSRDTLESGS
jgi:Ulp1 family protease